MNAEENQLIIPQVKLSPMDEFVNRVADEEQYQPQGTGALFRNWSTPAAGDTATSFTFDAGLTPEWWVILLATDTGAIVTFQQSGITTMNVATSLPGSPPYTRYVIPGRDNTITLVNSTAATVFYQVAAIAGIFPGAIF